MTDLRQSENYGLYLKKIGWQVDSLQFTVYRLQVFIKKIPFLGNFVKILRPNKQPPVQILDQIAHNYRAFAVQINYSPTKTLRLDLTPSLEEILSQMTKEARYEIRKAEKQKVTVRASDDIELFAGMWQKNALRRGFFIPFKKEIRSVYEAFGADAHLFLGYLGDLGHLDKPLAGVLILISGETASYFHACSTPRGRKLAVPSLVVWEAIKLAKSKGCQVFDFEGIYDERFPIKSWKGFTHFKKSFGGKEVSFPGSFTKYYNPFLRLLNT